MKFKIILDNNVNKQRQYLVYTHKALPAAISRFAKTPVENGVTCLNWWVQLMRNNCLLVGVSIKLLHIKKLKKMELALNRKYTAQILITP